jgi:hypothetical protein
MCSSSAATRRQKQKEEEAFILTTMSTTAAGVCCWALYDWDESLERQTAQMHTVQLHRSRSCASSTILMAMMLPRRKQR